MGPLNVRLLAFDFALQFSNPDDLGYAYIMFKNGWKEKREKLAFKKYESSLIWGPAWCISEYCILNKKKHKMGFLWIMGWVG